MIQTAEGALNETHDILQRMKELATQAANGTNTDSDRGEIQKEINQLTSEINRIGNTTEFNTKKLLNGGGAAPTTSTTSNGLTVPKALSGGVGATEQLSKAKVTFDNLTAADELDGKSFGVTLGGKTFTFTFAETDTDTGAGATQAPGAPSIVNNGNNSYTLNLQFDSDGAANAFIGTEATGTKIADALEAQLTSIINNDSDLKGKYAVTAGSNAILEISAVALDLDSNGKLTGSGTEGSVSFDLSNLAGGSAGTSTDYITDAATDSFNQGAIGKTATATIDLTGKSIEDLAGSGIVIGDKKIDFYDSSKGAYAPDANGEADFAVDLKGAGNAEAIVDKIVATLNNAGTSRITDSTGAESVYVTKSTSDSNVLQLTAAVAGAAGNNIKLQNNASVTVSDIDMPKEISGAEITSAKGLTDGEHQLTVTNVAASVSVGGQSGNAKTAGVTISIAQDSDLAGGTYRLIGTGTADTAKLQKLGSDGTSWSDVSGYESLKMDNTTNTYGDLTIKNDNTGGGANSQFDATSDIVTLTISENHYEAKLTESGGTAGTAVSFVNNQKGLTLKAQDGVGEVTLDMGKVSNLAIGSSSTIRFDTSQAATSTQSIGGTFTEKLQIGASNGQSFQVDFKDMRSQALNISGVTAGATAGGVEGAKFTSTKDVTNGTNNDGAEFALDVSSHESATAAIEVLDKAINSVSAERSKLGAYQNRLEHTINNLNTSSENLTAAESRVRDVDYALAA